MFQPSNYQTAIWDFIQNGEGNGIVEAVAGSGKTTTIVTGLEKIPKGQTASFFAFNKSIVKELSERVSDAKMVKTFHGLGMGAVMRQFGKTKVDQYKIRGLVEGSLKKFKITKKGKGAFTYRVSTMADMARLNLVDLSDEFAIQDLSEKYGSMLSDVEINALRYVLEKSDNMCSSKIDFVDMLYQPVKLGLSLPKSDIVFIDEAQDLSILQQQLFKKTVKRNGRFIAVGDPNQAIYGFAGADDQSFKRLSETDNVTRFPLSVSYRCAKSIIRKAQTIVPHIEAFDGSPRGIVRNGLTSEVRSGDMVLCRNNKLLTKLCVRFFAEGKKAAIKGNDFGGGLINLISHGDHSNKVVSIQRMRRHAQEYINMLTSYGVEKPHKTGSYKSLVEKIETIEEYIYPEVGSPNEAVILIKKMFKETKDKNRITLSTIHKAKGLESNRVHVAGIDLLNSKKATLDWEKQQEKNLEYVCYTRAKEELLFLTDTLNSEEDE